MAWLVNYAVPCWLAGLGVGMYSGSVWLGVAVGAATYALAPYRPRS